MGKKEQEMKVAANIAAIREQEVQKMRDKVKCMQDLLASRKQKLKITEEILVEKGDQKKHLDKNVEKMKRRGAYVEKELGERKIFEKEPPKKEIICCPHSFQNVINLERVCQFRDICGGWT